MGRRREYDEATVLTGAMHAFRRAGYEQVSVRDLERATSLSAGSLYHAYGGKEGLFDAAFAHYNDAVLRARIERYAPVGSGVDGLEELFITLLTEPDGQRSGCLITNTAVEFGAEAVHPGVRAGLAILEATFADRLSSLKGSDWPEAEIAVRATRLLALYQGVLVLVRAGHDLQRVREMIRSEFDALRRCLDER
jgi:AcrR family transcriptional regulator